jgi:hypothetical protein
MKNNPKSHGSDRETTDRHVYVEPKVQDLVNDLKKKYAAAQIESTIHAKKTLFWTKISTVLLLVYVGFNGWQACSAHTSLQEIKEQFRLDQRPYISVIQLQIEGSDFTSGKPQPVQDFEIGKPLVVDVKFKNVGKSPAINTIYHYHILIGENLKRFRIEPTDKGKKGPTIDPGSDRTSTAVSVIDPYERESAVLPLGSVVNWDGSQHVVLFGRVSYEDTLGHFYCDPYLYEYIPGGNWGYSTYVTIDDVKYSVSDLCPDKE